MSSTAGISLFSRVVDLNGHAKRPREADTGALTKKVIPAQRAARTLVAMNERVPFPSRIRSHRAVDAETKSDVRDLTRLLPLWPAEIADRTIAGREKLICTIERALRAERKRAKAGHWAYDLARHAALFRAWKRECAALAALRRVHATVQAKGPDVTAGPSSKIESESA